MAENRGTVCEAIEGRKLLLMKLSDGAVRLAEPYAFGRASSGEYRIVVYQLRGPAAEDPGWRTVKASEVVELRALDRLFDIRADYESYPAALDGLILCQQ